MKRKTRHLWSSQMQISLPFGIRFKVCTLHIRVRQLINKQKKQCFLKTDLFDVAFSKKAKNQIRTKLSGSNDGQVSTPAREQPKPERIDKLVFLAENL